MKKVAINGRSMDWLDVSNNNVSISREDIVRRWVLMGDVSERVSLVDYLVITGESPSGEKFMFLPGDDAVGPGYQFTVEIARPVPVDGFSQGDWIAEGPDVYVNNTDEGMRYVARCPAGVHSSRYDAVLIAESPNLLDAVRKAAGCAPERYSPDSVWATLHNALSRVDEGVRQVKVPHNMAREIPD